MPHESMSLRRAASVVVTLALTLSGMVATATSAAADPTASLTFSSKAFTESALNDGSVTGQVTLTLSGDTFSSACPTGSFAFSNVPAGLSPLLECTTSGATLAFEGHAVSHVASDSVTNVGLSFSDTAFSIGPASNVSEAVTTDISITFNDPAPAGTLDAAFNANIGGSHFNGWTTVALDHVGGTIFLTTSSDTLQDYPTYQVGRINPDGTLDRTFDANLVASGLFSIDADAQSGIWSIGVDNNGKVVLAGKGVPGHVARFNLDGTVDGTLSDGKTFNENSVLDASSPLWSTDWPMMRGLKFDSANNVYVPGTVAKPLVKVTPSGSVDTAWSTAFAANIKCGSTGLEFFGFDIDSSDRVIVAGICGSQGLLRRINVDGSLDTDFTTSNALFPADRWGNPTAPSSVAILDGADADSKPGDGLVVAAFRNPDGNLLTAFSPTDASVDSDFSTKIAAWQLATTDLVCSYCWANLTVDESQRLYVSFSIAAGYGGPLYRLNVTAADFADATFHANVGEAAYKGPDAWPGPFFAVRADGSGVMGGAYTWTSSAGSGIFAWNPDGSIDTDWTANACQRFAFAISGAEVLPDPTNLSNDKWIVTVERSGIVVRTNMDGTIDKTFGGTGRVFPKWLRAGWNYQESALAHDAQGNLYVSGSSLIPDAWQNNGRSGVIKLDSTGQHDMSFNHGTGYFPGYVSRIVTEPTGKFLLVGSFNNNYRTPLRRMSTTGADDLVFAANVSQQLPSEYQSSIANVLELSDGHILVASYDTNALLMLNSDGSVASTWGTNGRSSAFGDSGMQLTWARNILRATDGSIYVGGVELTYSGHWSAFVTKFHEDGTLDTSFNSNSESGISGLVLNDGTDASIALDSTGAVILAAGADAYDALVNRYVGAATLYRLNLDGTLDSTFTSTLNDQNFAGAQLTVQRDGRILAWGNSIRGNRNRLARLAGTTPEAPGAPLSATGSTGAAPGTILVAITPSTTGGRASEYSIRYRLTGTSTWITYGAAIPLTGPSIMLTGLEGGELYDIQVAGTNASGTSSWVDVAQPTVSGYVPFWSQLSGGDTAASDPSAVTKAIDVAPDGTVYAAGTWTELGGAPATAVARWTGSAWEQLGTGLTGTVDAVLTTADDKVYIGGAFTLPGGTGQSFVAQWDGSQWVEIPGFNGEVFALASNDAGDLYVGGAFTDAAGHDSTAPDYLVLVRSGAVVDLGTGLDGPVHTMTWANNHLYVTGEFTDSSAAGCQAIVVVSGPGYYNCLAYSVVGTPTGVAYVDGHVVVSGPSSIDETQIDGLGYFDDDEETWVNLGARLKVNSSAHAATISTIAGFDKWLFVGGDFNRADNAVSSTSVVKYDFTAGEFVAMGGGTDSDYSTLLTNSGGVTALATDDFGDVYVGGNFAQVYRDLARNRPVTGTSKIARFGLPIAAPGLPTVTGATSDLPGAVDLTVAAGEGTTPTRYQVRYQKPGDASWTSFTTGGPFAGPVITVTGLESSTNFIFEVRAFNQAGVSAWASTGTVVSSVQPVWSSMGGGVTAGSSVLALDAHNLGHVYAGGTFTEIGGVSAANVAVWDKAANTWSALGTGLNGTVRALFYKNGKLYAGGDFTDVDGATGTAISHVAVWDGSTWTQMGAGVVDGTVYAISQDNSGIIYVGGSFDYARDGSGNLVASAFAAFDGTNFYEPNDAAMTVDDTVKSLFNPKRENGTDCYDLMVGGEFPAIQGDNGIYRGAGFSTYDGNWHADRVSEWASQSGPTRGVSAYDCEMAAGTTDYFGWNETRPNTVYYNDYYSAGLGFNGLLDDNDETYATWMDSKNAYFTGAIGGDERHPIYNITMASIAASGSYSIGEKLTNDVWDDHFPFINLGYGINAPGEVIVGDAEGSIYVGGAFTAAFNTVDPLSGTAGVAMYSGPIEAPGTPQATVGDGEEAGMAKISITGSEGGGAATSYTVKYRVSGTTEWIPFTTGAPFSGPDITVTGLSGNTTYEFQVFGENSAGTSASPWTGSLSTGDVPEWSSMGGGLTNGTGVYALDAHVSGKVYAGGDFTEIGGVAASNVAVWDTTTNTWAPLGPGLNGTVRALFTEDDNLYAGGDFTDVGGSDTGAISHVAIWNGTSWSQMGGGVFDGTVYAIGKASGTGDILVGGSFDYAVDSSDGHISPALAAFSGSFIDRDTKLTTSDVVTSLFNEERENDTYCNATLVSGDFGPLTWDTDEQWRGAGLAQFAGWVWTQASVGAYSTSDPTSGVSSYGCDIAVGIGANISGNAYSGGMSYYFDWYGEWLDFSPYLASTDHANATYMDSTHVYYTGTISGSEGNVQHNIIRANTAETEDDAYGRALYNKVQAGTNPFTTLGGGLDGPGFVITEDADGNVYVGGEFIKVRNDNGVVSGTKGVARWGAPITAPPAAPSLSYSATSLHESVANDGTVDDTVTITLTGDTFTGADGDNWDDRVGNVPSGLIAQLERTSSTTLTLSLGGNATSSDAIDSITNLSVTLVDGDFTGGSASAVTNSTKTDLGVTFDDAGTAIHLVKSNPANEGTDFPAAQDLTFQFDQDIVWGGGYIEIRDSEGSLIQTFRSGDGHSSISGNTLTLNPTNALAQSTSYYVFIRSAAIGLAGGVGNFSGYDPMEFTFTTLDADQPYFTFSSDSVSEAAANDGSISDKITLTLHGDTFADDPTFDDDHKVVGVSTGGIFTNVPSGLTGAILVKTATTAEIYFSGSATSHAASDSITNLGYEIGDWTFSAGTKTFTHTPASQVTGASRSDIGISFSNPSSGKTDVTVTAASPTAITYGATAPSVGYTTLPSTVAGDWTSEPTCAIYAGGDTTYATPLSGTLDAGTYVTHCSGGSSTGYNPASYSNGTFTVSKASITVTAATPSALTAGDPVPTVSYTTDPATTEGDWTAEPTCEVYTAADTTFATPLSGTLSAGSYVTHCHGGLATNYDPTGNYVNGSLTVNAPGSKTDVTVSASSPSAVSYGTSAPSVSYTTTPASTSGDWSVAPSCAIYTAADTGFATPLTGVLAAGTYVTHCSGGTSGAYNPTSYTSGSFTVNTVSAIQVSANTASFTRGGTAATLGYTPSGFVNSESFSSSGMTAPSCDAYATSDTTYTSPVTVTSLMAAGSYTIHCYGAVTTANYGSPVTYVNATLTVSQTQVTLTATSPSSVTYGTTAPSVSYTDSQSTSAGDWTVAPTCAIYTAADSGYATAKTGVLPAGTYVTHCSGGTSTNFAVNSRVDGSFQVTAAAAVSVAADTASFTRGGTAATLGYTPSGFVNSETFASAGMTAPTCAAYDTADTGFLTPVTVTSTMDAGTYAIHCSGAVVTGNYGSPVTYTDAVLTVAKTPVAVTASSPASVLTGTAAPSVGYSTNPATIAANWIAEPVCKIYDSTDTSYVTQLSGILAVGMYVTHCAGGLAANFDPTSYVDGTFEVTSTPPAPRVITYGSSTLFEDAANDGSIDTVVTITLSGDTFTGSGGDDWSEAVSNVPDGLAAVLTRVDDTHLSLALTGNATAHADADSISNLTVTLGDSEFTGGDAAGVTGATKSNLVIDFADPGMPTGSAIKVEVKVEVGASLSNSNAQLTGNGLMPDSDYTFEMHSTVITLASGRTDALGSIHASVVLPPGVCVEPGVHALILTSTGPDGTPVQAIEYVTLGGSCRVWSKSPTTVTQIVVDDILFPFRTARLDKKAQQRLRSLAPLLRGAEGLVIYGYTQTNLRNDSRALKQINIRLGKQRARVVAEFLRKRGVTAQIKVLGRGAVLPKKKSAKYQWMNRRAVIVARFPAPTPPPT